MRYFVNTSAGQPIAAGSFSFDFELIGLRGGSWFGILAVELDSAASALLDLNLPTIGEINQERYDSEKKKELQGNPSLTSFPPPSQPLPIHPAMAVADRVGSLSPPPQVSSQERTIESTTLESADVSPPEEELLRAPSRFAKK